MLGRILESAKRNVGAIVAGLLLGIFATTVYADPSYNRRILAGNIYTTGQMYSTIATTLSPSGATQTINWDNGNVQYVDLESASATVTLTLSSPAAGSQYTVIVQQSTANPNRVLSWPAAVKWPAGAVPVVTASADAIDVFYLTYTGSVYVADQAADYR